MRDIEHISTCVHPRKTKKPVTSANLYLVDRVDALYLNVIKMNHLSHSIEFHDWKAEILPGASGKALLSPSHSKELTAYHAILNGSEIAI